MTKPLSEIYMHTSNGQKYYPFAPSPIDVDIKVIAHHLANRSRWAGATQHPTIPSRMFYSVAEHSVYVSRYLEEVLNMPELAMAGLLHDGSEAYNGDLIRPLKYSDEFREPFKRVELLNEAAVERKFDVVEQMKSPFIKVADEALCHTEWLTIVPKSGEEVWTADLHDTEFVAPFKIEMLSPYEAKMQFLNRFDHLQNERWLALVGIEA